MQFGFRALSVAGRLDWVPAGCFHFCGRFVHDWQFRQIRQQSGLHCLTGFGRLPIRSSRWVRLIRERHPHSRCTLFVFFLAIWALLLAFDADRDQLLKVLDFFNQVVHITTQELVNLVTHCVHTFVEFFDLIKFRCWALSHWEGIFEWQIFNTIFARLPLTELWLNFT